MTSYINPGVETATDMVHQAHVMLAETWIKTIVFGWRWWIEVLVAVTAWIVWLKFHDKNRTDQLLFAGAFTAICSTFLDTIGMALGLWYYPTKIFPLIPPFFTFDITIIPISTMAFLQFKPHWSPWLKSVILSLVGSFMFQPVSVWLGLYEPKNWKHFYSLPFVIAVYLAANYLYARKSWKLYCG